MASRHHGGASDTTSIVRIAKTRFISRLTDQQSHISTADIQMTLRSSTATERRLLAPRPQDQQRLASLR